MSVHHTMTQGRNAPNKSIRTRYLPKHKPFANASVVVRHAEFRDFGSNELQCTGCLTRTAIMLLMSSFYTRHVRTGQCCTVCCSELVNAKADLCLVSVCAWERCNWALRGIATSTQHMKNTCILCFSLRTTSHTAL
jgi:hypothetical protein